MTGNPNKKRRNQYALKAACGFVSFGRFKVRKLGFDEMLELKRTVAKLQEGATLDEARHGKRVRFM